MTEEPTQLELPGIPANPTNAIADSLGIADAFIQAVLKQDFEFARHFCKELKQQI